MFREILARGNGGKNWEFTNSPLFLDFLAGNQTYECTPWSMPLRTVFGWQKPCYLLGEGYVKTFKELMEGTEWDKYGVGKYEKCANCMVHCGFEGTAATDAIKHPLKMLPDPDARREDRRPDGAGYRPVASSARRSSSSHAMSRTRCPRSGPASPTPQRSRQRSSSANALPDVARRADQRRHLARAAQQRGQHAAERDAAIRLHRHQRRRRQDMPGIVGDHPQHRERQVARRREAGRRPAHSMSTASAPVACIEARPCSAHSRRIASLPRPGPDGPAAAVDSQTHAPVLIAVANAQCR